MIICCGDCPLRERVMSIWEKNAATGLAVGGPIGALLGRRGGTLCYRSESRTGWAGGNQIAFTVGVIALGAKMAKADGLVTEDDVNAFKETFKVPEGEIARIFNLAKQDVSGYEAYADQLATMFKGNRKLLEDVLDGLFHIAWADNNLHPREESFLADVVKRFGFTEKEFTAIKARQALAEKRNPYHALGVSADISNEALTSHYRKMVMENHPGNLVARGVPKEFVTIASKRMAAINQAYAAIAKQSVLRKRSRPEKQFSARHHVCDSLGRGGHREGGQGRGDVTEGFDVRRNGLDRWLPQERHGPRQDGL